MYVLREKIVIIVLGTFRESLVYYLIYLFAMIISNHLKNYTYATIVLKLRYTNIHKLCEFSGYKCIQDISEILRQINSVVFI